MQKRKKPAPKTDNVRRQKMAALKLRGKTSAEIGQVMGMEASAVRRQLSDPRTVTAVLALKERSSEAFQRIWDLSVKGIERDVKAKNKEVAHAARGQFLKYLTAGDPPLYRVGDQGTQEGDCTLEELILTIRKYERAS